METAALPSLKRSVGRPARLTLERVIDAACEIGIEEVDMVSLARKLGIGVATLYGYVDGREHLVALASRRLARSRGIEDVGQSWEDALREHARRSFAVYRETPKLISQLMTGMLGDLTDSPHTDTLLQLLLDRGLERTDALALYLQTNQIVIGAAVGRVYLDTLVSQAGGTEAFSERTGARCRERELSALGYCTEEADLPELAGDFTLGLERLIAEQKRNLVS